MATMASIPEPVQARVDQLAEALEGRLGDNLVSCVLYGSAVRGGLDPRHSDINLMIVLKTSTPEAHHAIAKAIRGPIEVDPFVLTQSGIERSMRVFGPKFASIRRDYRVLAGTDPLADLELDDAFEKVLCEQALRNLRLRAVHAYIVWGEDRRRYRQWLFGAVTPLLVQISEAARLEGVEVPHDFADRYEILENELGTPVGVIADVLERKRHSDKLTVSEIASLHGRLYTLLTHVLGYIEQRWEAP